MATKKRPRFIQGQRTLSFRLPSPVSEDQEPLAPEAKRGDVPSWMSFAATKWHLKHTWLVAKGVDDGFYCKYCSDVERAVRSGSLVFVTAVSLVPRLLRCTDVPGKYPDFPEYWAAHARRYSPQHLGTSLRICKQYVYKH